MGCRIVVKPLSTSSRRGFQKYPPGKLNWFLQICTLKEEKKYPVRRKIYTTADDKNTRMKSDSTNSWKLDPIKKGAATVPKKVRYALVCKCRTARGYVHTEMLT